LQIDGASGQCQRQQAASILINMNGLLRLFGKKGGCIRRHIRVQLIRAKG
jgi:hypothetical protein